MQTKPKANKSKKTIKIWVKINKNNREGTKQNKIGLWKDQWNLLARLTKKEKIQITNIKNESGDITIYLREMKKDYKRLQWTIIYQQIR